MKTNGIAGEIGVWSFGASVHELHSFQDVFSDEAGCKVASLMTFEQDSTLIEGALGAVVEAMTQRASEACVDLKWSPWLQANTFGSISAKGLANASAIILYRVRRAI